MLLRTLIDTSLGTELEIPVLEVRPIKDHAQARGPVTAAFAGTYSAGGRIISYIPNNAYLVRLDSGEPTAAKWSARCRCCRLNRTTSWR